MGEESQSNRTLEEEVTKRLQPFVDETEKLIADLRKKLAKDIEMEWISEGANDVLKALNDSSCFREPNPCHKKKVHFGGKHCDNRLTKNIAPSLIEDERPPWHCSTSPTSILDNSFELLAISKTQITATLQRGRPTTARPSQPQRPGKANAAPSRAILMKASGTTSPLDSSPSPPGILDNSSELPAINKSQLTATPQRARPTTARPSQPQRPGKANAAPSRAILMKASGTTSPLDCSPSPPGTPDTSCELPAINKSQLTAAPKRGRPTIARPVQRPRPAKTNATPSFGIQDKASGTTSPLDCSLSPPGTLDNSCELPAINKSQLTAAPQRGRPRTARPPQRQRPANTDIAPSCGIQEKRLMFNCTPSPPGSMGHPLIDNDQFTATIPCKEPRPTISHHTQRQRPEKSNIASSCGTEEKRRMCNCPPSPPGSVELLLKNNDQFTATIQRKEPRPTISHHTQRQKPVKTNIAPSCAIQEKRRMSNCTPSPPGSVRLPLIDNDQFTATIPRKEQRPTISHPAQRRRSVPTNIAIEDNQMCNYTPSAICPAELPLIGNNQQFTAAIPRRESRPTTSRPTQRRGSGPANIAIQQKRPMCNCTPSPPGSGELRSTGQSTAATPPNVPRQRYIQQSRPSRRAGGPTPAPPATRKPSTQMQGSTAIHKRKFKEKANQQSLAQKLEDKMKRAEENHRREIEKKRGRAQHSLDWWETGLAKNLELHENDPDDTYVRARAKANEAAKRIA
ncbi:unnamed protein product [Owenia fusiformis]|uniref:Uncharacterized protein n=1 Tax=Owenia fusiformis TaxID=6347 RepID=A0A8J1UTP0_OWEFU|nr:unnamed protein product [Owenia fusiformis]